jgi:hypothetical protein
MLFATLPIFFESSSPSSYTNFSEPGFVSMSLTIDFEIPAARTYFESDALLGKVVVRMPA